MSLEDRKNICEPSALKQKAQTTVSYLRENIEDRLSRDDTARQVWWEKHQWLKNNAWWHYRNFTHWLRDYDYYFERHEARIYFDDEGMRTEEVTEDFLDTKISRVHRSHKRGRLSSELRGLGCKAPPRNNEQPNGKAGGDHIAVTLSKEYGYHTYGFGKFIRLVEKEGQYGKFLSLEMGQTITDGQENKEQVKKWFTIPGGDGVLDFLLESFQKAKDGTPQKTEI